MLSAETFSATIILQLLRNARAMTLLLILIGVFFCNTVHSHESDSTEVNRLEVSPFYDTIIFSDVADILNEFEGNNMNSPMDALINSGSESDENIEDLLSEYQRYLDKAYKQKMNYLEKNKTKNKVPLIRHERYTKTLPGTGVKYDDNYYSNSYYNPSKVPPTSFNNPLDLFIPISPKLRFLSKPELTTAQPKSHDEFTTFEKRLIDIPPGISPKLRHEPIKPNCFCKNGQFPCDCKCKQCFVSYDSMPQGYAQHSKFISPDGDYKPLTQNSDIAVDDRLRDMTDNTLNIRIKVDIQLPKTQDIVGKLFKNRSREEDGSKESSMSNLNVPFPYFNFPIPMDLFGYKRTQKFNKHDSSPLHKITIHKKKKSRLNSSNKKHRKKIITFHNLNIEPQTVKSQMNFEETYNLTDYYPKSNSSYLTVHTTTKTPATEKSSNHSIFNKTEEPLILNDTQTEESIYLMVNISSDNGTEDVHKIENSVETEYTKTDLSVPTEKATNLRKKRETSTQKVQKNNMSIKNNKTNKLITEKISSPKTNDNKKPDKGLLVDTEILYWPNNPRNQSVISSQNITTIILERENKKAKLNMTKETIRHNRTRVLERAIFGDVNWDDVDTVAPVFMSFVGKYIRGVLTFCSQNICHSMKCADKTCVHRICVPNDRWNQRGHCAGSNSTDSVASLESIMDLPSNLAFEVVDILQDKMLGKLFGKVTLCITTKCISFVASKKNFLKSKCSIKDLNKVGHCPNVKTLKIM